MASLHFLGTAETQLIELASIPPKCREAALRPGKGVQNKVRLGPRSFVPSPLTVDYLRLTFPDFAPGFALHGLVFRRSLGPFMMSSSGSQNVEVVERVPIACQTVAKPATGCVTQVRNHADRQQQRRLLQVSVREVAFYACSAQGPAEGPRDMPRLHKNIWLKSKCAAL